MSATYFPKPEDEPLKRIVLRGENLIEFNLNPKFQIKHITLDDTLIHPEIVLIFCLTEVKDAKQDEDNPDGDTRRGWRSDDDWSGDTIWGQT